jgi:hypothetical protein
MTASAIAPLVSLSLTDVSATLPILSPDGVSGAPGAPGWRYTGQTYGAAVADIDRDGFLDLYVNHHHTAPAELIYGFGSATPRQSFVNSNNDQHGACFFDIDQDGDWDLLESRGGATDGVIAPDDPKYFNEIYVNAGGTLVVDNQADEYGIEYAPARGRMITPMNFEGRLGLFLGCEAKADGSYPSKLMRMTPQLPFHDWNLLHANLNGVNVAIGAHLGADDMLDVVALRDRRLTLLCNDGSGFASTAPLVRRFGALGNEALRDVQVADFNGDLRQDVFVAVGARSHDRLFSVDDTGALVNLTWRAGLIGEVYASASATAGDFDNDGDTDIAVLHEEPGVVISFLMNDGSGRFSSEVYADSTVTGKGDRIISGDFNNDGWLDFLVTSGRGSGANGDPTRTAYGQYVMLESGGGTNRWLSVELVGVSAERSGLGARVYVATPDGRQQLLEQDSGVHEAVQDSTWLHFGLGTNATVSRLTIVWAEGHKQILTDLPADQHITVTESRATLAVERRGDTVRIEATGGADIVSAPGRISSPDGTITDLVTVGLEANDQVTVSPADIAFDLLLGNGSDVIRFTLDRAASLSVTGDFDLLFL